MAAVLLMIAMTLTVKVMGFVGTRAPRDRAAPAGPAGSGQPDGADHGLSVRSKSRPTWPADDALATARQSLPDSELAVDVAASDPGPGR